MSFIRSKGPREVLPPGIKPKILLGGQDLTVSKNIPGGGTDRYIKTSFADTCNTICCLQYLFGMVIFGAQAKSISQFQYVSSFAPKKLLDLIFNEGN